MKKFFCDVCGSEATEDSLAVVRLIYKLHLANNRSRSYGGSRGSIDLCEGCRRMAIENKVGEIIAVNVVEKLKGLKR